MRVEVIFSSASEYEEFCDYVSDNADDEVYVLPAWFPDGSWAGYAVWSALLTEHSNFLSYLDLRFSLHSKQDVSRTYKAPGA